MSKQQDSAGTMEGGTLQNHAEETRQTIAGNLNRTEALLFDLDGTLTDSAPLVIECFRQMVSELHGQNAAKKLSDEQLHRYLGPPLPDSMRDLEPDASAQRVEEMVNLYRSLYVPRAATSPLFDGIETMLQQLHKRGYRLAVATSKMETIAESILQRLGIADLFEVISGAIPGVNSSLKSEVVLSALQRMGMERDPEKALMVGDRFYDVEGAKECGVSTVLATWGGGTFQGEEKNALTVVHSPEELVYLLNAKEKR